ncbi:MAG: tRNA lysidine(34) synthetase TilS [Eubacteriaceae bacterium]|nr:tRNA lysidine(34) synthetase TilS [Eubacteriaceae bacterium]
MIFMDNLNYLENKIYETIIKYDLISSNQTVLLALSGGADSTALLIILKKLSSIINFKIYALHLNHMLRSAEADDDEKRCAQICKELDIICYTKKIDVLNYSKSKNLSIEQAGRELRYKELFLLKDELNADSIVTAHHFDDNIETILMRCMRGTGIDGLCGIDIKRKDGIIRPLLFAKKSEITTYLEKNKISYCIDKTNYENEYFRNRIRNLVIPELIKTKPDFDDIIIRLCNQTKIIRDKIDNELEFYKNHIIINDSSAKINIDMLYCANDYIKPYIIRYMINNIKSLINIEKKNIDSILSMPASNTIWCIDLPGDIVAKREYEFLIIKCIKCDNITEKSFKYPITYNSENEIWQLGIKILLKKVNLFEKKYSSTYEKYIDYDKIKGNIFIRNRQTGDKFYPLGLKGSTSLKKYFINIKVPKQQRDKIPLLCDEENIIWIIGYALSDKYKVDEETKNILKISAKSL